MKATTKGRSKSAAVSRDVIESAGSFLATLPEKPKEELSLRESMGHLRESVQAALAKGYSYQDLADLLGKQGINISATTLKNYVPSGRRQTDKDKKAASAQIKSGRRSKNSQDAELVAADLPAKSEGLNGSTPIQSVDSDSSTRKSSTTRQTKSDPVTGTRPTTRAKSSTAAPTTKSSRSRKKTAS